MIYCQRPLALVYYTSNVEWRDRLNFWSGKYREPMQVLALITRAYFFQSKFEDDTEIPPLLLLHVITRRVGDTACGIPGVERRIAHVARCIFVFLGTWICTQALLSYSTWWDTVLRVRTAANWDKLPGATTARINFWMLVLAFVQLFKYNRGIGDLFFSGKSNCNHSR